MMEGPGADSEEKHEPVSDIDTAVVVVDLKALDPEWPIREAIGGIGDIGWPAADCDPVASDPLRQVTVTQPVSWRPTSARLIRLDSLPKRCEEDNETAGPHCVHRWRRCCMAAGGARATDWQSPAGRYPISGWQ